MDASRVAPSNLFEGDAGVYADALNGCIPLLGISHNGIHRKIRSGYTRFSSSPLFYHPNLKSQPLLFFA